MKRWSLDARNGDHSQLPRWIRVKSREIARPMRAVRGRARPPLRGSMSKLGRSEGTLAFRCTPSRISDGISLNSGLTQMLAKRSLSEVSPLLVLKIPTRSLVLLFENNLKKTGLTS